MSVCGGRDVSSNVFVEWRFSGDACGGVALELWRVLWRCGSVVV